MRRTTWFGRVWRWFRKRPRKEKIEVAAGLATILLFVGVICGGVYKGIAAIVRPHVSTTNVPKAADANGTATKDTTQQTMTPTATDGVAAGNRISTTDIPETADANATGMKSPAYQRPTITATDGVVAVNRKHVVRILEVPANIVTLSIQEVTAIWTDEDKTMVERQRFANENGNRPVRWEARLGRGPLLPPKDPNSPVLVMVRPPEAQFGIGPDMVNVDFLPQCSQDFLFLKKGDLIEFQGTLDFSDAGGFVRVRKAILLAYVRK